MIRSCEGKKKPVTARRVKKVAPVDSTAVDRTVVLRVLDGKHRFATVFVGDEV